MFIEAPIKAYENMTPFHIAAKVNNIEAIKYLLDARL